MKLAQRPLFPIVLLLLLLVCGIAIARTRMTQENGQNPDQTAGCADTCKKRLDKMLERCGAIPEAGREKCREAANDQYNKCLERCGGDRRQ